MAKSPQARKELQLLLQQQNKEEQALLRLPRKERSKSSRTKAVGLDYYVGIKRQEYDAARTEDFKKLAASVLNAALKGWVTRQRTVPTARRVHSATQITAGISGRSSRFATREALVAESDMAAKHIVAGIAGRSSRVETQQALAAKADTSAKQIVAGIAGASARKQATEQLREVASQQVYLWKNALVSAVIDGKIGLALGVWRQAFQTAMAKQRVQETLKFLKDHERQMMERAKDMLKSIEANTNQTTQVITALGQCSQYVSAIRESNMLLLQTHSRGGN